MSEFIIKLLGTLTGLILFDFFKFVYKYFNKREKTKYTEY